MSVDPIWILYIIIYKLCYINLKTTFIEIKLVQKNKLKTKKSLQSVVFGVENQLVRSDIKTLSYLRTGPSLER